MTASIVITIISAILGWLAIDYVNSLRKNSSTQIAQLSEIMKGLKDTLDRLQMTVTQLQIDTASRTESIKHLTEAIVEIKMTLRDHDERISENEIAIHQTLSRQ